MQQLHCAATSPPNHRDLDLGRAKISYFWRDSDVRSNSKHLDLDLGRVKMCRMKTKMTLMCAATAPSNHFLRNWPQLLLNNLAKTLYNYIGQQRGRRREILC